MIPYCRIPKSSLSKQPASRPHGFKVQSSQWGVGMGASWVPPHPTLPQEEREGIHGRWSLCRSRATEPGVQMKFSTGGPVLPTRLGLQAWPGTSCAGHWPGFSSGVPPE